jgi:hypothetical protein
MDVDTFLGRNRVPTSEHRAGVGGRTSLSASPLDDVPRESRWVIARKDEGRTRRLRMMWVVSSIRFGISGSAY